MGRGPPRPGGPWARVLLAASVLGSCLQPAPAQSTRTPGTIVLSPPSPVVGGGVRLAPQDPPQNLVTCEWFRSATSDETRRILTYYPQPAPAEDKGPAHRGRETGGPGCALHIAGLTLSDTGNYSLLMDAPPNRVLTAVFLRVSDPPAPGADSGLSAGAIAGIVIGSLAGVALVGVGAYFLYSRCRNQPPQEKAAPVLVYENLPPTACAGAVAPPRSPPGPGPTYETLQPRQPDVYEELK